MKLRELLKMFSKIQNADDLDVRFLGRSVERMFLRGPADGAYTIELEPDNRVGRTIRDPVEIRKIVGSNRVCTR